MIYTLSGIKILLFLFRYTQNGVRKFFLLHAIVMTMVKLMNTTTITISKINKARLEAILKHGESFDFGVSLLLLIFSKPKFNEGGILGTGRTVYPQFSDLEIREIRVALSKYYMGKPMKTPKTIKAELEE